MLEGVGREFVPLSVERNAGDNLYSHKRLNSNSMLRSQRKKQSQDKSDLEQSLKKRGISMGEFIGYWPQNT